MTSREDVFNTKVIEKWKSRSGIQDQNVTLPVRLVPPKPSEQSALDSEQLFKDEVKTRIYTVAEPPANPKTERLFPQIPGSVLKDNDDAKKLRTEPQTAKNRKRKLKKKRQKARTREKSFPFKYIPSGSKEPEN